MSPVFRIVHRVTASFLLLVTLVPAVGPFAMARLAPPEAMHCMRRPLPDAPAAEPAMHCHHAASQSGAAQNSESQNSAASPEASFRSLDCCCNNDCCRRSLKTSDWAKPAARQLSVVRLLIQSARPEPITERVSSVSAGPDSARAPPQR
jgi:hypothetical protein